MPVGKVWEVGRREGRKGGLRKLAIARVQGLRSARDMSRDHPMRDLPIDFLFLSFDPLVETVREISARKRSCPGNRTG